MECVRNVGSHNLHAAQECSNRAIGMVQIKTRPYIRNFSYCHANCFSYKLLPTFIFHRAQSYHSRHSLQCISVSTASTLSSSFLILSESVRKLSFTMYWSGILALLGWAATAIAQGNAGGDQTATCSAAQNYTYVGCYDDTQNGGKANFPFLLSTVAGNLKSYPGYTSSANLTIDVCATACRGHGHRYAGLYSGSECYCSPKLPYPLNPGTTTGGLGGYAGTNPGGRVANSFCGTPW